MKPFSMKSALFFTSLFCLGTSHAAPVITSLRTDFESRGIRAMKTLSGSSIFTYAFDTNGANNMRLMMWTNSTQVFNGQLSSFLLRIKLPTTKAEEPIGKQLESCFQAGLMNKQDGSSQKATILSFTFSPGLDVKANPPGVIDIDLGNPAILSSLLEFSCGR